MVPFNANASGDAGSGPKELPRVVLLGPPNVGKSVIFNAFTGIDAGIANYPGTTVDYKRGRATFGDTSVMLLDVPGTYSLTAANPAEDLAVEILEEGSAVALCVLDALNLESSLHLLLQVLERNVPTVVAINRLDLFEQTGKSIDPSVIERELGIPTIGTVAVDRTGFDPLAEAVEATLRDDVEPTRDITADWDRASTLAQAATYDLGDERAPRTDDRMQRWGNSMLEPWPGLPFAFLVLIATFAVVVGLGLGLRQFLLIPFFEGLIFPRIESGVESITEPGLVRAVLIGEYGFFIKGIEWPFALVLPYVFSFYIALSVLEDSGYLPRLAVLLDGIFERVGLAGSNVIPLLLGYGCAVPGIMATRSAASGKQRLSLTMMICVAVPCVAQTGAFIALLAEASIFLVIAVFGVSVLAMGSVGLVMDRMLVGTRQPTITDVPPLLLPRPDLMLKKVWLRLKQFVYGGAVHMIYAIAAASLLYELGVLAAIGRGLRPLVEGWLQLPQEAATPLMLGIVRRELTVLPLLEMELTTGQLFVGAIVGLLYVPCIAVFVTIAEEFNITLAGVVLVLTVVLSLFIGGLFAQAFLLL